MQALYTLSDTELLTQLRDGNEAALAEIYSRYWNKLFVVAQNRLNDEAEAEEVVQDVLFSLWKRRAELQIKYTLNTYLSVAVKYQIINRQSRVYQRSNNLEFLSDVHDQGAETTRLWFEGKELEAQLSLAINKLPQKCRMVFLKSREEGKTNAKIAEELEISKKTVEAHITYALNALKSSLHISIPLLVFLLKK